MPNNKEATLRSLMRIVLILFPSIAAMYGLHYVEVNELWQDQTKLRDLTTIGIMSTALALSFLIFSLFNRK